MTGHKTSILAAQPFLRGLPPAQLGALAEICDIIGLSWMQPPCQWRFGAVTTQAFAFDARAARQACDGHPDLGYELSRRFSAVVVRRLQATRARLLDAWAHPEAGP